jgi:hypothetical protein
MKRSNLVFLIIGVTIIFFGCSKDDFLAPELDQSDQVTASLKSAAKPSAHLTGAMDLYFDLLAVPPDDPVWVGTISFEGIEGEFGMRFFHLSPFRDFSQASPFEEYFEIYDLEDETKVYLGGPDAGVTTLANKVPGDTKYRMNGEIEVAIEPFEGWLERQVHMSGVITWQFVTLPDGTVIGPAPATAPGTFRIN